MSLYYRRGASKRKRDGIMEELRAALILALLAPLILDAAEHWAVQPLQLQRGTSLVIHDFKMPSSTHGIAAGCLARDGRCKPVSLVTADGGAHWKLIDSPETGLALFFLNETTGWMLSAQAIWKTSDSGSTWEELPESSAARGASRIYFRDERSGWTVGARQSFSRTDDGGVTWTPVEVGGATGTNPAHTSYDWIAFAGDRFGMIAGASVPPQPGAAGRGREVPHLTLFLDTRDGGATWTASTTSMFGRVTRVAFEPGGRGLGLVEFGGGFEFPSEVFSIDWKSGQSSRVFRRKDIAVTDIGFDAQGRAWLAGIERSRARSTGRVKVFRSGDLSTWDELAVDRLSAARATLVLCCGSTPWMATDRGALLRLSPE